MKRIPILVLLLLVCSSPAFSQEMGNENSGPPPPPPGYGGRMGMGNQQIRKQLEQIKIWQMTKEMNLPTAKAEKFFPLYNSYNDEMRSITNDRRRLIRSLDSAVDRHATEPEIKDQIKHILSLDDQLAVTHVKFIKSLGDILSPTEIARYMVFEQRFDREIRERIRMMMMHQRMGGRDDR